MLWNTSVYVESCLELTIFLDYKNLLLFTTTKQLNRRQVQWLELLGQYKFRIQYTPRKDNGRADALGRRSDHMKDKDITKKPLFKQQKNESLIPIVQVTVAGLAKLLQAGYLQDVGAKELQKCQPNATLLL